MLLEVPPNGTTLIERLAAQGDQVRVIEQDASLAERWKRAGAQVARGWAGDADLVERAAQGVRSVVVIGRRDSRLSEVIAAACEGAAAASTGTRLIVCAPGLEDSAAELVRRSGLDYVLLRSAPRAPARLLRRRPPSHKVVEAIDAADDLSGHPRLELDLTRGESWSRLELEPP